MNFLEASGRWRPDDAKRRAKELYDPRGLLNPGKMRDFTPEPLENPALTETRHDCLPATRPQTVSA